MVSQVNASGIINTFAGNGNIALAPFENIGDGGPATNAAFGGGNTWAGLAVDGSGNVYIADPGNRRVRKVNRRESSPPSPAEGRAETAARRPAPASSRPAESLSIALGTSISRIFRPSAFAK